MAYEIPLNQFEQYIDETILEGGLSYFEDGNVLQVDEISQGEYEALFREHAVEVKYELIKKLKGNKEADNFINQNLNNPALHRTANTKAIEEKNFDIAVSIARDGISCNTKDKPGLALEWYDWLLRIAKIQKDTPKIKETCRFMRRMIKLGDEPMVKNLVEKLRKEYPQRKALLEELNSLQ